MHKPPVSIGWEFEYRNPYVKHDKPIHFTTTGNYSVDYEREVSRAISGFVLLPEDRPDVDFSLSVVLAYLVLDGVRHQMSSFVFTEDVEQKGVVLDAETQETADLTNVALADGSALLLRNDGKPETLYAGFSPTAEIERLVLGTGQAISVEAGDSANTQSVTWDGSTTVLAKIRQLAELAGHHPPWLDNFGVIRSVSASRVFGPVLQFERDIFMGEQGSVSITNNYLTIPNRVIVTSNSSAGYQVTGTWNAPASWRSSEARRGYVRTLLTEVQGVYSNADAERVAATIGQRLSARRLTAKIIPTYLLDGPRVIKYDDAYWTVRSWRVGTMPDSTLDFEAEEMFVEDDLVAVGLEIPGII